VKREVTFARPWLARLTLAAVLVGFVGLAARVVVSLAAPDLLEQKLAGAERYLYYRVTRGSGPVFELTGDETSIRLVTHAVVPPLFGYDPAREYEYGIHLTLDLGGGKKWERDVYTRSRQSKARRTSGTHPIWLDENTFAHEPGLELTDDRLLVITLPANVPVGATAKVTLVGDMQEGFVRAYSPAPRDNPLRFVRELPIEERSRIAEQTSYVPWDRLTSPEDLASVRFTERRLSAEGKEDVDYETRTLYTTGFRVRPMTTAERGLLVTAARGAAVNVVGPAKLDLAITRPAALEATVGALNVRLVGETAARPAPGSPGPPGRSLATTVVPLPLAGGSVKLPVEIPPGVFTITMTATAPARVNLLAPPTKSIALGELLEPDEQLTTAYLADPNKPAIAIALDGPQDVLARVVRVDVRALATAPMPEVDANTVTRWPGPTMLPVPVAVQIAPPQAVTGTLTLETLDGDGKLIASTSTKIESEPSHFDIAKLFGKLTASVCEPVGVKFLVPPNGRMLRLVTDRPALLQIMTPLALSPPADRLEPPYDAVPLVMMHWRYARYIERGWLPLRAQNHDALAPDRVALVATQARLEPRVVPLAPDVRSSSLDPKGSGEHQTVIERVDAADAAEFIATWDEGHYTRVLPGKPMRVDLGKLPTRATIRYRPTGSDEAVVGAHVTVMLDGQKLEIDRFNAARGSLRLPAGTVGAHAVTVETNAPVQLLIDRPPVGGGELYALRTVHAIGKGHRVRLEVVKRSAAQQNINVLLYTPRQAADASTVHVRVDGGTPARATGVPLATWTTADRMMTMPPADRAPTLGFSDTRGAPLYPRRLVVPLGDDLPIGKHTIELSVSGDNVWARFFTLDNAPEKPRALQWRADSGEDSP